MNPNMATGGSSFNGRLLRHFAVLAVGAFSDASLATVFKTYLDGHLKRFGPVVQALSPSLLNAATDLHAIVGRSFRRTPSCFHYGTSVRHLARVVQGVLAVQPAELTEPAQASGTLARAALSG